MGAWNGQSALLKRHSSSLSAAFIAAFWQLLFVCVGRLHLAIEAQVVYVRSVRIPVYVHLEVPTFR